MKPETERALGELAGRRMTKEQHDLLDRAYAANPREFEKLVEFCLDQEQPMGYLIAGAKRIVGEQEAVGELRKQGDAAKAGKRAKSALNYSQTALGLVPPAEQEADLRDQFPWITPDLLQQCLAIGAKSVAAQDEDMAQVETDARRRRAYNEDKGHQRLVLTRGEIDVLRRCFPDHSWSLEQDFTARGVGRLRGHARHLEQKAAAYKGGSPAHTQSLHDAEMLGRVVTRYETREATPPTVVGTPDTEVAVSGES